MVHILLERASIIKIGYYYQKKKPSGQAESTIKEPILPQMSSYTQKTGEVKIWKNRARHVVSCYIRLVV